MTSSPLHWLTRSSEGDIANASHLAFNIKSLMQNFEIRAVSFFFFPQNNFLELLEDTSIPHQLHGFQTYFYIKTSFSLTLSSLYRSTLISKGVGGSSFSGPFDPVTSSCPSLPLQTTTIKNITGAIPTHSGKRQRVL